MSYRNPRQTIDNRLGKISQGVSRWYDGKLKDRKAYEAAELKDNEEVATKIKSNYKPDAKYDTAWNKAKASGDKFTSKLRDQEGGVAEGAPRINEQINEILANIGTELDESLKDPSLSERQQNELRNQAIANMNNFTQQMANWQLGMDEYLLARTKAGGVGGLLADETGHRNKDLIKIFEHITDDKDSNVWMTWKNGQLDFIEGKFDKDNEFQVKDYVDFTGVIGDKDQFGDGQFFLHNQEFNDDVEFAGFDKVIQEDLAGRTDLIGDDGKLDYGLVEKYFLEDDAGQKIMKTFIDEENEGKTKWGDLGGEGVYSDENYIAAVLKRGLIKNGLTAPVVEEEDTTTTTTNAAGQTTTTNTASTTTGGGASSFLPSNNQTTTTPVTTTTPSAATTNTQMTFANSSGETVTIDQTKLTNPSLQVNIGDGADYIREILNFENSMGSFSGGSVGNYGFSGTGDKGGALLELFKKAKGTKEEKAIATINKYIIGEGPDDANVGGVAGNTTILKDLGMTRADFDALSDDIKRELVDWKFNSGRGTTDLVMIAGGGDWDGDRAFTESSPKDIGDIDVSTLTVEKLRDARQQLYKGRIEGMKTMLKNKKGNVKQSDIDTAEKGYKNSQQYRGYSAEDSKTKNTKKTSTKAWTEEDKKKLDEFYKTAKKGDSITLSNGDTIKKS